MLPSYLQKGDTIAIAAPARKISEVELMPAVRFLEQAGFNVYYEERLFAQQHQFAGAETVRASYMQSLLDNPEIKAIWCARGGYGSVRIIDRLDFSVFMKKPKWIVGYSDVTVFHNHLNKNYDIATLHATMPINVSDEMLDMPTCQTLLAALTGEKLQYQLEPHQLNRLGDFSAPVVGGNLSMLYSLLGSPSDIDTDGKVLFIEDLDEYLYHIDRMMSNLERNGKLTHLAGLLVGHLSDMHDNQIPYGKTAEEIVSEHCANYDFPVIFNFPAGHLSDNRAIRMGTEITCKCFENKIIIEN